MTRDEIIRMANEAGVTDKLWISTAILFADRVERATLERAAKACEEYGDAADAAYQESDSEFDAGECNGAYGCAAAIRRIK